MLSSVQNVESIGTGDINLNVRINQKLNTSNQITYLNYKIISCLCRVLQNMDNKFNKDRDS